MALVGGALLTFINPLSAVGNTQLSEPYTSSESFEDIWEKMIDHEYDFSNYDLSYEEIYAIFEWRMEEARLYAEGLSPSELAVYEVQLEHFIEAEIYFWENLSPEFLWYQYKIDNPTILLTRDSQIEEVKAGLNELYNKLVQQQYNQVIEQFGNIDVESFYQQFIWNNAVSVWSRLLGANAGLSASVMTAIQSSGTQAGTQSTLNYPTNAARRDAMRHFLWNALSVRNTSVGNTQALRTSRTRILTTYREHATTAHRFDNSLRTTSPTAAQVAQGTRFIRDKESLSASAYATKMNTPNGRDELKDLWNNHWGRADGVDTAANSHLTLVNRFYERYLNTTVNNGLARGTGTSNLEMPLARINRLRANLWHRTQ